MAPKRRGVQATYGSLVSSQSVSREEVSQVARSSHFISQLWKIFPIRSSRVYILQNLSRRPNRRCFSLEISHWKYLLILGFSRQSADVLSISENGFSSASAASSPANSLTLAFAPPPLFAVERDSSMSAPRSRPVHIYPRADRHDLEGEAQERYTARKQFLDNLDNYIPLGSIHAFALDGFFVGDSWEEQPPEGIIGIEDKITRGARELRMLHRVGLVRLFTNRLSKSIAECVVRVYALSDDVGRRWKDRELESDRNHRKNLNVLMEGIIDFSAEGWAGNYKKFDQRRYLRDRWWDPDRDDLLFYTFNTLSSPTPDDEFVACPFSSNAMAALLDTSHTVPGLNTLLYPYQGRSAATMIRREAEPARILDPRLEALEGPVGNTFYYDKQTKLLLRDKRTYEEPRGGILAETMGLGKTLICLAAILATRGHWPHIPPEFSTNSYPVRHKVGKLVDMTAAAIARQQIPWRVYFQDLAETGQDNQACVSVLERNVGSYIIVPRPTKRTRRPSLVLKEQTIRLCPVTLVVVPVNLFHHWQNEIASHVSKDALKVLFVRTMQCPMPSEDEIIVSDVIRRLSFRSIFPPLLDFTNSTTCPGSICVEDILRTSSFGPREAMLIPK